MQSLECAVCATSPLEAPRLAGGVWRALCPGCGTQNALEPDITNVFLPVRFRVVADRLAPRPRDGTQDGMQPSR